MHTSHLAIGGLYSIGSKSWPANEASCTSHWSTASGAEHLIEMYPRRGYELVGEVDWEGTNDMSVVLHEHL